MKLSIPRVLERTSFLSKFNGGCVFHLGAFLGLPPADKSGEKLDNDGNIGSILVDIEEENDEEQFLAMLEDVGAKELFTE